MKIGYREADRQLGQALLITLLILTVGGAMIFYHVATPKNLSLQTDLATNQALVSAREALVGYAVGIPSTTPSYRPGKLPCPASDTTGVAATSCNSVSSRIGRLPWKTLGLDELKDGAGEPLWYAVSEVFKNNQNQTATTPGALNSNTPGDYTVSGTVTATQVIAIIFAPGALMPGQDRSADVTETCTTTNTSIPRNRCAANYLEGNNNSGTTGFVTAAPSDTFNDKLILITREQFFPQVEMRVAREIRSNLNSYYQTNFYFPYAAPFGTQTSWQNGLYRGRIPTSTTSPLANLVLPPWFVTHNGWHEYLVYAVAPRCTPRLTSSCTLWFWGICWATTTTIDGSSLECKNTTTSNYLSVSGVANDVRALVLSAGTSLGAQNRPCASASECLEDAENNAPTDNYVYVKPQRVSGTNNDQLIVVAP